MKKSYVDLKKTLERFHEKVEAYTGDGNLGYNSNDGGNNNGGFSKVGNFKKKNFNNVILAITITSMLGGGFIGEKYGFRKGYESGAIEESQVSDLDKENIVYTIDNAPDIVILKYLEYAVDVNPNLKGESDKIHGYYEEYKKQVTEELKNKENSQAYKDFREKSKNLSSTISFDKFRYAYAFDEEGNMINDNKSSLYIDNENCRVYMPTFEKVDSNDLNNGEFIKNGVLYVDINNPSSLYYKGR